MNLQRECEYGRRGGNCVYSVAALTLSKVSLPCASVKIAGKTALVTGGSAGAGKGIAQRLEAEGARVVIADLDTGVDVTDDAQLKAAIDEARPDILMRRRRPA